MSAELRDKYYETLMNDDIMEIEGANEIINDMTSGKVPTDDITAIRCAKCKKKIKDNESLFEHMSTDCPGCLIWEFPPNGKENFPPSGKEKKGGKRKTRKKQKKQFRVMCF